MICRAHRLRPWFGVVVALLLLPLPAQADDIEPEPYVEEAPDPEPEPETEVEAEYSAEIETAAVDNGPSVGSKIFDCMVLRPLGFAATIVGAAFFVPTAVLASGVVFLPPTVYFEERNRGFVVEGIEAAWDRLVAPSVEDTFRRPLGDF